jgi:hypothetical protein
VWGKAVALSRYQQNQVLIWNRRTPGQLPTDPGYQSATTVAAGRLIAGAVGLAGAFFEPATLTPAKNVGTSILATCMSARL